MSDNDAERSQARADQELKVTDRRHFTSDGQLRSDAVDEQDTAAEESEAQVREDPGSSEQAGFEHRPVEEPTGVDFTMLINGMAEPALVFLGEISHPDAGQPRVDLERARIQIDMLDLLRVKCRGNLTPEEEGLLDRILYQLRMLYVARANQPPS